MLPRAKSCFFVNICVIRLQDGIFHQPEKMLWHDAQLGLFSFSLLIVKENLFHCNTFASWLQCFWYRQGLTRNKRILIWPRALLFLGGKMAQQVVEQCHWQEQYHIGNETNMAYFALTSIQICFCKQPWFHDVLQQLNLCCTSQLFSPIPLGKPNGDFTCSGLAYWFLHLRWSWGPWLFLLKTFGSLTHLRRTFCFANGFPNHSLSGNINISSYLCPTAKQSLVTDTFGPRFTLLRYWRPFPIPVSDVIGSRRDKCATVMHDWHWLEIYFSGSIDVCQVFGISILCLVMFGVVFSCGCNFFQQVFVLINVSASYHLICHLKIHQHNPLSCELFHPAAARFAWRTFLATIVGGGSVLWPFQRRRCWRYWSLKRC